MRVFACIVIAVTACEPMGATQPAPSSSSSASPVASQDPPADDCRRDIPDCSAACALRATNHLEFIDWYDRRCAAVVLGKNPDKTAGAVAPEIEAGVLHPASRDDLLANPYR